MNVNEISLGAAELGLLDAFQRGLPLEPRPYAVMAEHLGISEASLLAMLQDLVARGVVSRVGAVVAPHRAGWSTLAAMRVPPEMLEAVAHFVSSFPEVNHNYEREHRLNLWFVVAAAERWRVEQVLREIEYRTGLAVLDLPLEQAFRLDLGFKLS
ncbi:MAG: Lrp/AsnC family transcriptional regulator [Geminicoccaceae bacterium]